MSLVNMILKWNTGAWVLKGLGVKIVMRRYGTYSREHNNRDGSDASVHNVS